MPGAATAPAENTRQERITRIKENAVSFLNIDTPLLTAVSAADEQVQ